jgi:hypothetical protein
MILSFFVRLMCIGLASFFLLHVAGWLLTRVMGPVVVRFCARLRPSTSANVLLAFRLFPSVTAIFLASVCGVIYQIAESHEPYEYTSVLCISLAVLGAASVLLSLGRTLGAGIKLWRYLDQCSRKGSETSVDGSGASLIVIEDSAPFFFLAGIVQPRLVAARSVIDSLTHDQLEVAIRHEQAHFASRDNLKRLLILMTPDVVPFVRGFGALETEWCRFAEWAADDHAVAGNSTSCVSLAAALVHLARAGSVPQFAPLVNPLMANSEQLAARVDRLLRQGPSLRPAFENGQYLFALALLATGSILVLALLQPASVSAVHELLENLH